MNVQKIILLAEGSINIQFIEYYQSGFKPFLKKKQRNYNLLIHIFKENGKNKVNL